MSDLPAVARLYYSGPSNRRYKRASTRKGPGEPLCFVSVAEYALRRQAAQYRDLVAAAKAVDKLYGHVWDRAEGGLIVFPENVEKFDAAYAQLHEALASLSGAAEGGA